MRSDHFLIHLELIGLSPIAIYDVCFRFDGGRGSLCHQVKTTLIIREKGESVVAKETQPIASAPYTPTDESINVDYAGVALVAFVGLGLVFALMVCVFYEKALTAWASSAAKRAAAGGRAVRDRVEEMGATKKKKKEEEEGEQPEVVRIEMRSTNNS